VGWVRDPLRRVWQDSAQGVQRAVVRPPHNDRPPDAKSSPAPPQALVFDDYDVGLCLNGWPMIESSSCQVLKPREWCCDAER
jgi:hypothetical protein